MRRLAWTCTNYRVLRRGTARPRGSHCTWYVTCATSSLADCIARNIAACRPICPTEPLANRFERLIWHVTLTKTDCSLDFRILGSIATIGTHVELLVDQAADEALSDPGFLTAWQTLHGQCSHATGFQSPEFVCAWYASYRNRWQPVVIRSANAKRELNGLWLLAYDLKSHSLTHAGAHQAEYHAWLALPDGEAAFLASALTSLQLRFRFATLRFKYLPAVELVDRLRAVPGLENRLIVRAYPRQLARLNREEINASFSKKSNKSRFNRLKRLGALSFRRLVEPTELEAVFDDLIAFYDFRQAAVNHVAPFRDDPLKRNFYSNLFATASDKQHVTVTYLNDRPIAALWGTVSGNTVHIGLLIHSPLLAEHSPGKLHVMQLCNHLLTEGKDTIDLTPGGDPWKQRFANAQDEVSEVILYRSRWARRRAGLLDWLRQRTKRGLVSVGMPPSDVRLTFERLRRARPSALLRKVGNWAGEYREVRVYRGDRAFATKFERDKRITANSIAELLSFEPAESWQSRETFLSRALTRLEQAETVYTISVGGRLAHSGWLVRNQTESRLTEVRQTIALPRGSVALYDYYTHPEFRGRGLYRTMIKHMLNEAFSDETTQYAYITVLASNRPSRHVIESLGFQYVGSLYWKRRLTLERKWADAAFASEGRSGA